jgi:hypothetical protein
MPARKMLRARKWSSSMASPGASDENARPGTRKLPSSAWRLAVASTSTAMEVSTSTSMTSSS